MQLLLIVLLLFYGSDVNASFERAYQNTAQIEGGYVYHPYDRGGETYDGIARKAHPDWFGWALNRSYNAEGKLS